MVGKGTEHPRQRMKGFALVEREKKVAFLYLRHFKQTEIAFRLAISQPTVSKILTGLKKVWQEECRMDRQERIEQDLAALDDLDRAAALTMDSKDTSPGSKLQWAQIRIKLMERRSKLLGLDADTRIALTGGVEQERCAVRLRLGNRRENDNNGGGSAAACP